MQSHEIAVSPVFGATVPHPSSCVHRLSSFAPHRPGHPPLLHYRVAYDDFVSLAHTGMPLGIEPDVTFGLATTDALPGDVVLLYSDGVTDALSPAGEEFGLTRLMDVLRANAQQSPDDIVAELHAALDRFDGGLPQHDDITLLLAKRIG